MTERSESLDPMALELEPWPLEPSRIVEGEPRVSGRVLDSSDDDPVECGPILEVGPCSVGPLRAGERTTWRVREDLRTVYQVTQDAE
jgi:uncharacterized protein